MATKEELADVAAGNDRVPNPAACFVVAGALTTAAALVAGAGGQTFVARSGRWTVAAVLAGRAAAGGTVAAGLLGMPPPSERFRRLDRRWYRPLCLTLALCAARSASCTPCPVEEVCVRKV
jgi:hypothetical protein